MGEAFRILVVDDDEDDFGFLSEAFGRLGLGHRIRHLENGEELLDYLSRLGMEGKAFPHLILLDINMPKIDGLAALAEIKSTRSFRSIPVIMYSTSSCPVQKEKCTQLGALDFITKAPDFGETIEFARSVDRFLHDSHCRGRKRRA
jgi:CheY-like chemotaxis protein